MKLRFWQKSYLLTLLLFILFFCSGVFFIGFLSQERALANEKRASLAIHTLCVNSLKKDLKELDRNKMLTTKDVFDSYANYYLSQQMFLEFRQTNVAPTDIVTTQIPADISAKCDTFIAQNELLIKTGGNVIIASDTIPKEHYFCVIVPLQDDYCMISATKFPLINELRQQNRVYIAICCSISLFLGVLLFFVLRRISHPLQRLTSTADEIASGDLTVRAVVAGNDEISELAESFNNMAESIVSKMEALEIAADQKERIADNLSHEIRTPLTAIQGYAEYMILAKLTEDEKDKALGYIIEESQRLQKISDRMLKLSVMRREEAELTTISLPTILEHVSITITAKAAKQKIRFYMETIPEVSILGDSVLLESLFTNIADNALKACDANDTVTISFRKTPQQFCVIIQDTGRGMTDEEVSKLGEPFYRPDKARSRKAGGAGLGITLCCQIAKLHEATLVYYSKINVGTEVHITFNCIPETLSQPLLQEEWE